MYNIRNNSATKKVNKRWRNIVLFRLELYAQVPITETTARNRRSSCKISLTYIVTDQPIKLITYSIRCLVKSSPSKHIAHK